MTATTPQCSTIKSRKVMLSEVAHRVSSKVAPEISSDTIWVGADHLIEGDSEIRSWAFTDDPMFPPTFRFAVPEGAVLLHSRNPRKVARTGFSVITGEKLFALQSRDERVLLTDFLLAVLQATNFQNYAVARSGGSVNKFLNWTTLADFEFDLPPLEEQKQLVELLNAKDITRKAYERVLNASLRGREAQTQGAPETNGRSWQQARLGDLGTWYSGATPRATNASYYGGDIPFVTIADLNDGPVKVTQRTLTEGGAEQIGRLAPENSVFLSMYGTIGKTGIARGKVATNQAIAWLECDPSVCLAEFVLAWLGARSGLFDAMGRGATQRNINREMIRGTSILLPPLEAQQQIVNALTGYRELERAVTQAQSSLSELRSRSLDGRTGATNVF